MRSSSNILLGLLAVAFLLVPVSVGDTFAAGSRVTKYDSPYARTTPQEEVKKMKGNLAADKRALGSGQYRNSIVYQVATAPCTDPIQE